MPTRYHLGVNVPASADAAGIMASLAAVLAVANDVDTGAAVTGMGAWTRDTTAGSQAIYSPAFGPRNSRIIIAVHDSGTPSPSPTMVASADTYTAANVLIGICDNAAGNYIAWQNASPFYVTGGGGSLCTFAGYYRLGATAGATTGDIRAWLSTKDLNIQYRVSTSTVQTTHFGAIVKGATGYEESDGYRYGGMVSGAGGDMAGDWRYSASTGSGQYGKNGTTNAQAHAGLYIVGGSTWQTIRTSHIRIVTPTTDMAKWGSGPVASRTGLEMQRVLSPEYTVGSWSGVAEGPLGQTASIVNDSTPALWGWLISSSHNSNESSVILAKSY